MAGAWCPTCKRDVPLDGPEVLVEFAPQAWRLSPDGRLDTGWGADVFIDYTHVPCGTKVRLSAHSKWSEEAGTYVDGEAPGMIEVDAPHGQEVLSELDGSVFAPYDPPIWVPTYRTLLAQFQEAVRALHEKLDPAG